MKILHIVTLVTPDGAYGGPTRVAVNQSSTLRGLGHDVMIAAGQTGFGDPQRTIGGVPATLFAAKSAVPGVGYAATRAPAMKRWIAGQAGRFDIAHVHLSRDLVTIPAAAQLRKMGIPYVVQTHGMITPGSHPLAPPIDRLWTIPLLRQAALVFYLNEEERVDLSKVGGADVRLRHLGNGVPLPPDGIDAVRDPEGVEPEVLFLARLHERKRPAVFADAALMVLRGGAKARFSIVGPEEGAERDVDQIIEAGRREGVADSSLRRELGVAPEDAAKRMSRASIYVLPATREPFGMTIVEALTLGIPVIVCADGGLAPFVQRHDCGLVVDGTVQSVAAAIAELLSDSARAKEMGERGRAAVRSELSIESVGLDLESIYRSIVDQRRR